MLNSIERKVLELIGEDPDSPDVFTDDDTGMSPIRSAINDAVSEIVMITGSHKRQYFIPLREEQQFYRLVMQDGDFGWVTDAWSVTSQYRLEQTDLIRLNHYDPRWMLHTGRPETYFTVGKDILGVYPKPSGTEGVIELTVVEIPAAYESGEDRVKLRAQFENAAVHFAVGEFWATRGDAQEAQKYHLMYLSALGLETEYQPSIWQPRYAQTVKEPWPRVTG